MSIVEPQRRTPIFGEFDVVVLYFVPDTNF